MARLLLLHLPMAWLWFVCLFVCLFCLRPAWPAAWPPPPQHGAVVFTIQQHGEHISAWILLVAVHPANQGRGLGKELIGAALDAGRAHGARTAHLASSVPRYLWPGVEVDEHTAGMLFETLGFSRDLVGINMAIPSTFRREAPPGVVIERETGSGARRLRRARVSALDRRARRRDRSRYRVRGAGRVGRDDRLRLPLVQSRRVDRADGDGSRCAARWDRFGRPRRRMRRSRRPRARHRRDRVGQQPTVLRQVRRNRVPRLPGRAS